MLHCRGKFPLLSNDETSSLLLEASDEEIRREVFGMAPLKVPGMDGFQVNIFQTQWDVIGYSVCSLVRQSLGG